MPATVRFTHPPINEMVIGMQFASRLPMRSLDFADAWSALGREDYPIYMEQPELGQIAIPEASQEFLIYQGGLPPQRYWFLSSSQERLIQLQSNRLLYNWRRLGDDSNTSYPSYDELIASFTTAYSRFRVFAKTKNWQFVPQIAEVTYINEIPLADFEGLGEVLRGNFDLQTGMALPSPRATHVWQYGLNDIKAQLNVNAHVGVAAFGPVLRLELYLAGIFGEIESDGDIDGMRKRYDIFHERMNELFVSITTNKAHELWGMNRNGL